MELPGYYPTRVERSILEAHARAMIEAVSATEILVIDLGAGDASKTTLLLRAARDVGLAATYAPIDVSSGALASARAAVERSLPGQAVLPICDDYLSGLARLATKQPGVPRLALLLGSNVGNLEHDAASQLLRTLASVLEPADHLLVGFDRMKDPRRLRGAYDDDEGVTAAFNLNLLRRINRELGADFDLGAFRHIATFDPSRPAMVSWLLSTKRQDVHVLGRTFELDAWEAIHTEISCKYREEHLERFSGEAGLAEVARWTDDAGDFTDVLYRLASRGSGDRWRPA
jgi:dimethylhistidine N-methyltransferase